MSENCPWLNGDHDGERCLRDQDEKYYPFRCTEINRVLFIICHVEPEKLTEIVEKMGGSK